MALMSLQKLADATRPSLVVATLALLATTTAAQVVEFRASIDAAQEAPTPSTSPATGNAIMFYDVAGNTFDLVVTISGMSNAATASHVHEAPVGTGGPAVTSLGSESVYTRSGNTLTATFHGLAYGGDKLNLLGNGAYFNIHSAEFAAGEVRGQLIAQPKRLYANIDVAQERAAFPTNAGLDTVAGYGAAIMTYNPGTGRVNLRISLADFNNSLTNSHIHAGAAGVSGPVATGLGAGTSANYVVSGGTVSGAFPDLAYTGDPVTLLTGGAYLNFHSNVNGGGECRGQIYPSEELLASRLINVSTRGFAATGEQALITGISVGGPEPVRVLVTAKGPSLAAFGVGSPLANPSLTLYDTAGRVVAANDDIGTVAADSDLAVLYGVPANTLESAVLVVLPPGNYTAAVSGVGGTGIALIEAYDVRNSATVAAGPSAPVASVEPLPGLFYSTEHPKSRVTPDLRGGLPISTGPVLAASGR